MKTEYTQNLKEVDRETFYKTMGPLDVKLSVLGDFPYTTEFKLYSTLKGKVVESYSEGNKRPIIKKYYLAS
jgi:hypothetical protein